MEYMYLACVIISLGMLFWLKIFDVRNSTTQFCILVIMVIANLGSYFLATSTNLQEALVAQKIVYIGGLFMPAFYFFLVLEICHFKLPASIGAVIMTTPCILYGTICTIGKTGLFYKKVGFHIKNGVAILEKEYGPAHTVHEIVLCAFVVAALGIAIYSMFKRKSVNRRGVFAMVIFMGLAVTIYIGEKLAHIEYEFLPIVYVVLMIGALIPVYDSNLYTVYENADIINEQLGRVGFLTFNKKRAYKGCNIFMANVFPELSNYRVGQTIEGCSEELLAVINQITKLEEIYKKNEIRKHAHIHLEAFPLNDRYFNGMIHVVTNAFGELKGYTVELRDDTDHHTALALTERYNEELASEVDAKTKRIRIIQEKIILGMAQMVESRDLSTGGHIKRTSDVVRIFARKLAKTDIGLDEKFLDLVVRSAPMHDLGKIGVDDAILRKQGRFTDEEYAVMKKHSEIGYHMVSEVLSDVEESDFVLVAENVAHYHHEKVNGMGYPSGLKGQEIPIEARIMALADVFDALVSKRCYKDAFSYDKAFDIIKNDAGTHFDKQLAEVFLSCRKELEDYYNKSE